MSGSNAAAVWDGVFATPDPWSYDDGYEQQKRAHLLQLTPRTAVHALEVGCAEGHFTVTLAAVVQRVTALDVSRIALERAAARCSHLSNVAFHWGDAFEELPPGPFDAIVCSEVLYYARNRFVLDRMLERLAARLTPAGHLIVAHPHVVADDRSRTGFDFHEVGTQFIGQRLHRVGRLRLTAELETELYRMQVFRKSTPNDRADSPVERNTAQHGLQPTDRAWPFVKWGGCDVTAAEARHLWRSPRIPVLMYHRIAESGPAGLAAYRVSPERFREQLSFLRREGYRSISLPEAVRLLAEDAPPAGRFVVFTFDDAYVDFIEQAWPLLREHGFTATVFVPVSWVGIRAEWDRRYGEPAPIMTWDQIRRVHQEGASIGSHAADHRRLIGLTGEHEVVDSIESIGREIGARPDVFSFPFNAADDAAREAVAAAGYQCAVLGPGLLDGRSDPSAIPRQEVYGSYGIAEFAALLSGLEPAALPARIWYRWQRAIRDRRTYTDF
jgi:peptidoglycan/xylan/chitin deacetylase (PgdA/CDA1 family)/2-polyprenyl-3-methyl-5-hydroxy-6-metoxy-1,4-benzoquinol methylase